ncbi:hypothetical protein AMAG_19016 [Allomyces macrogynus ATCC 38327]|uniref:Uncharacterized protein n=1 Tax=Allomyces macrogynus (strain ATCC 38327) TaxID=578462 RepID=A0A0L0SLX5_ALLM3|nr:hypothetical protein AMAG_19016 [Allomyces macrogynus ATCC 38327]|eukprot:KNE63541.1 hypothetical protein AMAG_19016 [Allomyces macrogynus ATCC 38327]
MSAPSAAPATPAGTVDPPARADRVAALARPAGAVLAHELGKKLSRRADRQDLIQRNIMKGAHMTHFPVSFRGGTHARLRALVDPAKPGLSRVPSAPGPVTAGALAPPAVIPRSISNDPARPPATAAPADLTLPPPLTVQAQGEIDTDSILTPKKEQDLERLAARIGRRPKTRWKRGNNNAEIVDDSFLDKGGCPAMS